MYKGTLRRCPLSGLQHQKYGYHLRILSSIDYKITPRAHLKTKDDRVEKCILLSYERFNQYRIFNIPKQRVEFARDVRFLEDTHKPSEVIKSNINANHDSPPTASTKQSSRPREQKRSLEDLSHDDLNKRTRSKGSYDEALFAKCQETLEPQALALLKEIQIIIVKLFNQDRDSALSIFALLTFVEVYQFIAEEILRHPIDFDPQEPFIYKKAMASPHADNWYRSMVDEMNSFDENNTHTFVPMPPHQKVLGGK